MMVATVVPNKNPRMMSAKCWLSLGMGKNVTAKKYSVLAMLQNQLNQ